MKQLKKAVALLLTSAFVLTGCAQDEQKFVAALDKLSKTKYYEQQSSISFELNYYGGDEYFREEMAQIKHLVDAFAISSRASYERSVKDNAYKSHISADVKLDPITLTGELWFETDMSGDSPANKITAKIPALAKAFMPDDTARDYLYIDYVKYMDAVTNGENRLYYSSYGLDAIPRIFMAPTDIQKRKLDLIEITKISKALNGNYTLSAKAEGDSEKLTLKMSDKQLKSFILALLTEMKTNDETLDIFVEAFAPIEPDYWEDMYAPEGNKEEKRRLLREDLDEAIALASEYFAGNTILGDKGLIYEITINENGYITNENITITLRFSDELYYFTPYHARVFMPSYYLDEDSGVAEITVAFKTKNSGFDDDKAVKLPKLTKENTFDVVDAWIAEAEQERIDSVYDLPYNTYLYDGLSDVGETPVDFPIVGSYGESEINSVVSLMKIDIHEYRSELTVPLRQAAELFGGEVGWDAENKFAFWKHGDMILVMPSSSNPVLSEMYYYERIDAPESDLYLTYDSVIVNGTAYIGLSDIEQFMDVDFGFDNSTNTLLVR